MVGPNMGGTTALPVKNILKQIHPMMRTVGTLTTSVPKKQVENNAKEGSPADDKAAPIVAFNKPPLPPVLGPLIFLSLLEMGSGRDGNDD